MRLTRAGTAPGRPNRLAFTEGFECQGELLTGKLLAFTEGFECQGSFPSLLQIDEGFQCQGSFNIPFQIDEGFECQGFISTPLATPTYPNGYSYLIRLVIPFENAGGADISDFMLLIDETILDLRTVANGGKVQHASGFDIRLELTTGTVVPYRLDTWSATTGRFVAKAKVPVLSASVDTQVLIYFGKSGLSATEAQPALAYSNYIVAWDCRTGEDLTGQGRTMTPTAVGTTTLIGDAGAYNGTTSRMQRANLAGAADGLASITVEALVRPTAAANNKSIVSSGPGPSNSEMGMQLDYNDPGDAGNASRVVAFKIHTTGGIARIEGPADSQADVGVIQHLAGRWQSGETATMIMNGLLIPASNPADFRTGTTLFDRGGPVSIGYSAVDGYGSFDIDEVRISAFFLSTARVTAMARNYLTPRDFYGIGQTDAASDTNRSPVAVPMRATASTNVVSTLDPAARAIDPDSGDTRLLTVSSTTGGSVNVVSNRAELLATAVGIARTTATITDSGFKFSAAPLIWTVGTGSVFAPPPPTAETVTVNTSAQLIAALNVAAPGQHIVLNDGTYAGAYSLQRAGNAGNPIVIRAANPQQAIITGTFVLNSRYAWLYQLRFNAGSGWAASLKSSDNVVGRCVFFERVQCILIVSGSRNRIGYSEFDRCGHATIGDSNCVRIQQDNPMPQDNEVFRCWIHGRRPSGTNQGLSKEPALYLGTSANETNYGVFARTRVEFNLFDCGNDYQSNIRVKSFSNIIRLNTLLCTGPTAGGQVENRQGEGNQYLSNYCNDISNFEMHGRVNLVVGNRILGRCSIDSFTGYNNSDTGGTNTWPGTGGGRWIGNNFTGAQTRFRIGRGGDNIDTSDLITGFRVEAHDHALGADYTDNGSNIQWFDSGIFQSREQAVTITPTVTSPNITIESIQILSASGANPDVGPLAHL